MTENQQTATTPEGRGTQARRIATRVLRVIGDWADPTAAGALAIFVLAWLANDIIGFAPVLDWLGFWDAVVITLAVGGAVTAIEAITQRAVEVLDPDARDGDDLWDAVKVIDQVTADVDHDADYDDVLVALQSSRLLPSLYALLTAMRDAYAAGGEMEEASALSDTVALVRSAAESLGHKDVADLIQRDA